MSWGQAKSLKGTFWALRKSLVLGSSIVKLIDDNPKGWQYKIDICKANWNIVNFNKMYTNVYIVKRTYYTIALFS